MRRRRSLRRPDYVRRGEQQEFGSLHADSNELVANVGSCQAACGRQRRRPARAANRNDHLRPLDRWKALLPLRHAGTRMPELRQGESPSFTRRLPRCLSRHENVGASADAPDPLLRPGFPESRTRATLAPTRRCCGNGYGGRRLIKSGAQLSTGAGAQPMAQRAAAAFSTTRHRSPQGR